MIPRHILVPSLFLMCPLAALAGDAVSPGPDFNCTFAPEVMPCDELGRIEVAEGVMVGAEFAIIITDLIELPGEANKVEATLLNQGGGGEWTEWAVLTLAKGGQALRFDYPDGSTVVWARCG